MNKQEAIEKLESKAFDVEDTDLVIGLSFAKHTINQIDEPEKPIVPQFVADWYERNKDDLNTSIYSTITRIFMKANDEDLLTAFESWLMCNENSIVTVVSMHQFGYEVEKEKLYTARLEIIYNERESYINKDTRTNEIFLDDLTGLDGKFQIHFTQAELEKLDVWNNPAFEIEEVKQ